MYMSKEIQNVTVSFNFPGLKFGNFVIYKRQKKTNLKTWMYVSGGEMYQIRENLLV